MIRALAATCAMLCLTGCDVEVVEREIGYKGRARVNPWLAAERYAETAGYEVKSAVQWTAPAWDDALWVVPAQALSNGSFVDRFESWVREGGHLVLLVEHTSAAVNDWSRATETPVIEDVLIEMLDRAGLVLETENRGGSSTTAESAELDDEIYQIDAAADATVSVPGGEPGLFASVPCGNGRVTVLADARPLRNRWISDKQHADLWDALLEITDYEGRICFLRGTGLSFWSLLRQHLWPVLLGFAALLLVWLWRSLTRFGPVDSSGETTPLRGYEHHLEALGRYQWDVDRAVSLLAPLRDQIVELGQQASLRAGRRDDDLFQFLADRAGLPRERVMRALADPAPAEPGLLARAAADLQALLRILQTPHRT